MKTAKSNVIIMPSLDVSGRLWLYRDQRTTYSLKKARYVRKRVFEIDTPEGKQNFAAACRDAARKESEEN